MAHAIAAWLRITDLARRAGLRTTVTAAFGCPFEGEVAPATAMEVAKRCTAGGPDGIAIADTIGVGVPDQVTALATGVRTALDASAGGICGCPFAPDREHRDRGPGVPAEPQRRPDRRGR